MQPTSYTKGPFRLSQSAIKSWKDLAPSKWYDQWILGNRPKKSTNALSMGSLVDTLCFEPNQFGKRFIVSEVQKPSDTVCKILMDIFNHITELNSNVKGLNNTEGQKKVVVPYLEVTLENRDIVDKFTKENKYYESKPDQAYNTLIKQGTEYFGFLKKVGNKVVITEAQKTLAQELKEILYTNPITKGFFIPKKDCEVHFQVSMFGDFPIDGLESIESIPIKGLVDIIHINHKRKEVREIDLKFTNSAHAFADYNGPVRKFDYTMQHSFYDCLIHEWLKTFNEGKYKDYEVMNALNCVIDDDIKQPYIYEYSKTDLHIKRYGIENTNITGWENIINEIAWHIDKNKWDYPREHILHGKIQINIFKK